jgi:hypothetical protein|tara:strand:+ start:654 stop:935 length:282 start_codon:yes stop_codon:yes gene_type:complete
MSLGLDILRSGNPVHRSKDQSDYIWNDVTKDWEFSQTLRDELDYRESDEKRLNDQVDSAGALKALVKALNNGDFQPAQNYTLPQIKLILKNNM